jgi:UDP-2-acetamido-3-amino-2,3-dideoxy-glucuronate N-acetyltransferase
VYDCAGGRLVKDVFLGKNAFIGNRVVVGNRCKIRNHVSVHDNVTLEEGVFRGPSMVFTYLRNPRALVWLKDEYRDTSVKKCATLGANCTIACGGTIGGYAFIGAGGVVNKDAKPYALLVGVPAGQIGLMSEYGERLDLSLHGHARARCSHTCYDEQPRVPPRAKRVCQQEAQSGTPPSRRSTRYRSPASALDCHTPPRDPYR